MTSLLATDDRNAVALVIIDLSSAFDMVALAHDTLMSHLKNCTRFRGNTLEWFQAFLNDFKISVCIGQHTSSTVL